MELEPWLKQAWADHGDAPERVATELAARFDAVRSADDVSALARLAQHLYAVHLGRPADGRALLAGWAAHPLAPASLLAVYDAALALQAGDDAAVERLDASGAVTALALQADALVATDSRRAGALWQQALARADAAPTSGAHVRALAVAGNNIAAALEQRAARSAEDTGLMLSAAAATRRFWALAGGWLETERAEYRLAMSWLAAGDAARARGHARQCLAIVQAQRAPALERFFAFEALALAEIAAGDAAAAARAAGQARREFDALDGADQPGCRATLARLPA